MNLIIKFLKEFSSERSKTGSYSTNESVVNVAHASSTYFSVTSQEKKNKHFVKVLRIGIFRWQSRINRSFREKYKTKQKQNKTKQNKNKNKNKQEKIFFLVFIWNIYKYLGIKGINGSLGCCNPWF